MQILYQQVLQLLYALRLAVHKHNRTLIERTSDTMIFLIAIFRVCNFCWCHHNYDAYSNVNGSASEYDGDVKHLHLSCRCLHGHCGLVPTLAESVCCREIEKKLKKRLRPTLNWLRCSMPDHVLLFFQETFLAYRQEVVLFMEHRSVIGI